MTILVIVSACTFDRDSPEEVLHEFCMALQEGDGEKLKSVSSDEGIEMMSDWFALGCEPVQTTVDSIYCDTQDSIAYCSCYETREGDVMQFDYLLERIDGEWRVTPRGKDIVTPDDPWRH